MPSYLLDTHTLLWYFEQSDQLSTQAFKLITNMDRPIFVRKDAALHAYQVPVAW